MAESNEPNALPSNDQQNKPVEDPSHHGMSIESVLVTHITEAKPIKLICVPSARRIDGKEDGPGDDCPHKTDVDGCLEEAEI